MAAVTEGGVTGSGGVVEVDNEEHGDGESSRPPCPLVNFPEAFLLLAWALRGRLVNVDEHSDWHRGRKVSRSWRIFEGVPCPEIWGDF